MNNQRATVQHNQRRIPCEGLFLAWERILKNIATPGGRMMTVFILTITFNGVLLLD
jgi:hypothetical protein